MCVQISVVSGVVPPKIFGSQELDDFQRHGSSIVDTILEPSVAQDPYDPCFNNDSSMAQLINFCVLFLSSLQMAGHHSVERYCLHLDVQVTCLPSHIGQLLSV